MYALIMAGGSGTRLWPKSRKNSPKQLHSLTSEKSMLTETIDRIKSQINYHKIWIVTNKDYAYKVKEKVPGIPADNIIGEPFALGNAMAICLGMMRIHDLDPFAKVMVLWSDNHIKNKQEFSKTIKLCENVIKSEKGIIVGVNPTYPATGYGYIEMGAEIKKFGRQKVFHLKKFVEKPDFKTAKEFMTSWRYLWNTGISCWTTKKFLNIFEKLLPKEFKALQKVKNHIYDENFPQIAKKYLQNFEKIPIDYAIYEKTKDLVTIPAELGWSDIGNWAILKDVLQNGDKNYIRGKHTGILTKNNLIYGSERLIATIGVKDLIIVDTDDAILIAHKKHCEKVKDLTKKLEQEGFKDYL